jgi:hypothetical protein
MASKFPTRSFRALSSSVRPRSTCLRASNLPSAVSRRRGLSTTESSPESTQATETESRPRWSYTPPGAKAPFRLRGDPSRPEFHVNEDPAVLDQFYIRFLGSGGDKLLSDEIKWLAVTHKSFDQGRRGFNDRLAFLGMSGRVRVSFPAVNMISLGRQTNSPTAGFFGSGARCRQFRKKRPGRPSRTTTIHTPGSGRLKQPLQQHQEFPYEQGETRGVGREVRPAEGSQMGTENGRSLCLSSNLFISC